jgi:hypothetical protein
MNLITKLKSNPAIVGLSASLGIILSSIVGVRFIFDLNSDPHGIASVGLMFLGVAAGLVIGPLVGAILEYLRRKEKKSA